MHAKLLAGFLLVAVLFFAMGFTGMALILRDEASIATVLRENNRFNSTMARLEASATEDERVVFQKIRVLQDVVMTTVADIANLIRDGRADAATSLQLGNGYPLYQEIERLVQQVAAAEAGRIARLRDEVTAANRRSLLLAGGFLATSVGLALLVDRDADPGVGHPVEQLLTPARHRHLHPPVARELERYAIHVWHERRKALEAGASHYLTKPYSYREAAPPPPARRSTRSGVRLATASAG